MSREQNADPNPLSRVSRIHGLDKGNPASTDAAGDRFASLFAEPRHFRSDCRMVNQAVRNGWLDGVAQHVRDDLVARFERACSEREAQGYSTDGQRVRALLAQIRVIMTMEKHNLRQDAKELQTRLGGPATAAGGRPREKWVVSDHGCRVEANELRRTAIEKGIDLATVDAVILKPADASQGDGERVAVNVEPCPNYGLRLLLVCPGCGQRCQTLFPIRAGMRCRECGRIGYRQAQSR